MRARIIIVTAITVVLCSCMTQDPESICVSGQQEITVSAFRADGLETKTQRVESNGSVLWSPGDAISLFYGSGVNGGSKFVSNGTEPSTVTNFTGTIGAITGGADISVEDTYFWGLYPYDPNAICDGTSITTTLPSFQEAVPGTFANNLFPSLGHSQGLCMGFYNICGGVRFTVTKDNLKSVTLRALGGELLTGKARIGIEAGVPTVLEVLDGSDSITLTAPAGKYFEVGKFYYFITFPQPLSEGIEMTFESFMETGTYERRTSNLTIKRSTFGTLRNVDQDVTYIQKTGAIPVEDPVFKNYLLQNYDNDSDGEISFEEAAEVTEVRINPSNQYNLQSLKGIEYMPNLEVIDCPGEYLGSGSKNDGINKEYYYLGPYNDSWSDSWGPIGTLRYADVSNNPNLRYLNINANSALGVEMGTINVSNCPLLTHIDVIFTWLEYPDVSSNTELDFIQFSHLRGTLPDFSRLNKVKGLFIEWPQDKPVKSVDLDVSHMPDLEILYVSSNIKSLSDLSSNPKLEVLYIWDCPELSGQLNLSGCPDLEVLTVNYSNMQSLDVSQNIKLKELYCTGNRLTSLNLSSNDRLEHIEINSNSISDIDLSGLALLREFYCDNNPLTTLDVSHNTELRRLGFSGTQISSIDVSNNTELTLIGCDNIPGLTHLDLRQNVKLEGLCIRYDGFSSIDISHNALLRDLLCEGNTISTLNVSNNPLLEHLSCVQKNHSDGENYLQTLYIAPGQSIPYVTDNRSADYIPATTVISIAPSSGGGEGTGNDEW